MANVKLAIASENEAIMAKIDLVMARMDTLFNILDPRPHNVECRQQFSRYEGIKDGDGGGSVGAGSVSAYCEQEPLQGERIGDNSGDIANQQPTLRENCSYVTPPTRIHKRVSYVEKG